MANINFKNVNKFYDGVQIIFDFNETINDGEFVTLLGASGCGKTTILRMVAGFEKPTTGEILINNKIVSDEQNFVPPENRNIGMVFQSYAIWPHMNVFNNIAYPLKIKGVPKSEIQSRVLNMLDSVDMSNYVNRMPEELSGGQQQRVALARALISEPELLLLDEPLSNLDAKLREEMRYEIKDIQKRAGITVLYVTHDQTEAMTMSDRVIVLNKGVVQQVDTPFNICRNPANKFVYEFTGKLNFVKGQAESNNIIKISNGQILKYQGDKNNYGEVVAAIKPENVVVFENEGNK